MRQIFTIPLRNGAVIELGRRTVVVGVLNVTPDSFSDGGRFFDSRRAIDRAIEIEDEGADILEIGGESTRPGAELISTDEEKRRVMPILDAIAGRIRIPVAIDTTKAEVARDAIRRGAVIVNDVSALRFDPELSRIAAEERAVLVLMHMRETPAVMQRIEPSSDIFSEIELQLSAAIAKAEQSGVSRDRIIVDPGIGFGKTLEQNLRIINRLDWLSTLNLPIMLGSSRKSFIGRLTGRPESERQFGTAASIAAAIIRGAHMIRVHDVKEMVEVVRVADAIANEQGVDSAGVLR
ncbi:MAG: dihydropteroate synthase [Blastocatellia bacterium AA13]|nr:MAG: dihydropteroate synthase [Blastocatellia bacterium AA13]